jgi:superfamily II DNA or RNA helicase
MRTLPGLLPTIRIGTAFAELHGIEPGEVLPACLTFRDPRAHFNEAFRRGDWDGKVELFNGRRFPAGLVQRVVDHLTDVGVSVRIVEEVDAETLDLADLTDQYLVHPRDPSFRLRDHQLRAIRAMLESTRGVVDSPTGSGKTEMIAAACRYLYEHLGLRSLIVEPKKGIAQQTATRLGLYYGSDIQVGYFAEGERREGPIIVATAQTLLAHRSRMSKGRVISADPQIRAVVNEYEVLVYDECHRTSSPSWYEIGEASTARRRYGLSGTPLKDQALEDARLVAMTGKVICSIPADELVSKGYAARPKIAIVMNSNASGPDLPEKDEDDKALTYADEYRLAVIENEFHNTAVVKAAAWCVDRGRQTLVFCRRMEHFQTLSRMLDEVGVQHIALWGGSSNMDRDQAKRSFKDKTIRCILATTIWDEGEDVANVGAIVLGEGVKVTTVTKQRIGRGMRPDTDDVWVVDFVSLCSPKLSKHAHARAKAYEAAGYDVCLVESWPPMTEFIERDDDLLPFEKWA